MAVFPGKLSHFSHNPVLGVRFSFDEPFSWRIFSLVILRIQRDLRISCKFSWNKPAIGLRVKAIVWLWVVAPLLFRPKKGSHPNSEFDEEQLKASIDECHLRKCNPIESNRIVFEGSNLLLRPFNLHLRSFKPLIYRCLNRQWPKRPFQLSRSSTVLKLQQNAFEKTAPGSTAHDRVLWENW